MSYDTVVIQGTLKPDGIVELDEIPAMTPGRVQVTLQPVLEGSSPQGGLANAIEEMRQYQQSVGYQARTPEEMADDENLAGPMRTLTNRGCRKSGHKRNPASTGGSCCLSTSKPASSSTPSKDRLPSNNEPNRT